MQIDKRLAAFFGKYKVSHSFWIDDLAVSGNYPIKKLVPMVRKIFQQSGFSLHTEDKFSIKHKSQQQKVTGLVINLQPTTPKHWRLQLKQALHICNKYGIKSYLEWQNIEIEPTAFLNTLRGRIVFLNSINADKRINRLWWTLAKKYKVSAV